MSTSKLAEKLDTVVTELANESEHAFAAWDNDLFEMCSQNFKHYFRWRFKDDPEQLAVWRAYMQIIAQGIGAGHLRQGEGGVHSSFQRQNLLGYCLSRVLPNTLVSLPQGERLPALAMFWNLCEGLLGEPEWVQRYVLSRADEMEEITDLEVLLVDAMGSAYAPATDATWTGALTVTCLDVREELEDFLPGEMYLAAPRVLCIADRRDPESHTAVFLAPGGCRLMGATSRLSPHDVAGDLPGIRVNPHRLSVGDRSVDLPQVARPYTHAATTSGFVIVSAVDSQRLWVIESP